MTSGFVWSEDPLKSLDDLYQEALKLKLPEPNAMSLATCNPHGEVSVRVVLFKGLLRGGISFYTNYEGRKGRDISAHNQVGANFFWPQLERQVRVSGLAEKTTRAENEAYFKTRARVSQIGAWASAQSTDIPSHEFLQEKYASFEAEFADREVPCPPNWGGFIIVPQEIEFWIGRRGRLHERYVYQKRPQGWNHVMRSP